MKAKMIALIVALLLILGISNSLYTVRENEYACTVRFSQIIETTAEPGLHFKVPVLDSIRYYTKATQFYDIPPSEVLTSDKQNMTVDCYILWHISDPKLFYQSLGNATVAEKSWLSRNFTPLMLSIMTLHPELRFLPNLMKISQTRFVV